MKHLWDWCTRGWRAKGGNGLRGEKWMSVGVLCTPQVHIIQIISTAIWKTLASKNQILQPVRNSLKPSCDWHIDRWRAKESQKSWDVWDCSTPWIRTGIFPRTWPSSWENPALNWLKASRLTSLRWGYIWNQLRSTSAPLRNPWSPCALSPSLFIDSSFCWLWQRSDQHFLNNMFHARV